MSPLNLPPIIDWLHTLAPSTSHQFTADSRKVQAGDIFFAYPVGSGDGRNYIQAAIDQGARAIVYEENDFTWNPEWVVPHFAVRDLLWNSGYIVSGYLQQPDAEMFTVAITGTNGKTSCSQWLARALSLTGTLSGVIGTLGIGVAKRGLINEFDETGFTTPDAIQLHASLAMQKKLGIGALAIEASSIGLHQGRMNGMHVDVAVFTNFTRDHLDYHGDMASYEAAKTTLFTWPDLKAAVVNLDDPMGLRLAKLCTSRGTQVVGYCVNADASVASDESVSILKASGLRNNHGGTSFHLESPFGSGQVKTHMVGRFNVSNILAVLATLFVKGVTWRDAVHAVEQLTSVPGRMEQLGAPGRVLVVIDYAHTPDALEKTLHNLREVATERHGKLWCVFGCGGDRDPGKRPEMGKIAEIADEIMVTSDNPRSEDPDGIIAQIVAGMTPNRQPEPMVQADRATAILYAINHAGKNDVVLLAGKGHEAYQEIKGKKIPFSDSDHAHIALVNLASKGVGL